MGNNRKDWNFVNLHTFSAQTLKQTVLEPKRANGNSIEKGKKGPKWVDTIFPYFDKVDETIYIVLQIFVNQKSMPLNFIVDFDFDVDFIDRERLLSQSPSMVVK